MNRVAAAAGAAVVGAVVGVLALLVHRLGGAELPWGLVLAAAASVSVSAALGVLGAGRGTVIGYGVGWCAAVLLALFGRPEGDYMVAADWLGWVFLVAVSGAVVIATVLGVSAARRTASSPPAAASGPVAWPRKRAART